MKNIIKGFAAAGLAILMLPGNGKALTSKSTDPELLSDLVPAAAEPKAMTLDATFQSFHLKSATPAKNQASSQVKQNEDVLFSDAETAETNPNAVPALLGLESAQKEEARLAKISINKSAGLNQQTIKHASAKYTMVLRPSKDGFETTYTVPNYAILNWKKSENNFKIK